MKYETELNENQTLAEKYKQKFENDVSWKQSNRGFCVKIAGHYSEETHNKNNDLAPLFVNRRITKVSRINKKGYKNEPLCVRLVASLLPIGERDEENNWKNIEGIAVFRINLSRSRIHYADINSLYASAMRYFMPVGNFELNDYFSKLGCEKTI